MPSTPATKVLQLENVDKSKRDAVEGTALIEREEIDAIRDPDDLRDLIQERTEEPA